jgi:hypothetical protein
VEKRSVSEERRHSDQNSEKLDRIEAGVNEMRTALFGPAYDPKMGFIYRTEARLQDQETRVGDLEKAHWKQTGIVAAALAFVQLAWNWLRGH